MIFSSRATVVNLFGWVDLPEIPALVVTGAGAQFGLPQRVGDEVDHFVLFLDLAGDGFCVGKAHAIEDGQGVVRGGVSGGAVVPVDGFQQVERGKAAGASRRDFSPSRQGVRGIENQYRPPDRGPDAEQ